jgi:serine/threonine protein phosphatase PrpC
MVVASSKLESGGRGEDRLVVERAGDRLLIVVADGAGGTGGAAVAAQDVCDAAVATFRAGEADAWTHRLQRIDSMLATAGHGGLSTAVVVEIADEHIHGASVGDSGAWLVLDGTVSDLTERQIRKPLLGSGAAKPVAFGPVPFRGRLLVATDGLFKYATRAQLVSAASRGVPDSAVTALIDAVRMPSGRLQDDVGVVVCEGTG